MDAAPTLFAGYLRRGGQEDRVTEVFAALLQRVPALLSRIAEMAGIEPAPRYWVETQVRVENAIIDMRIRGLTPDGATAWTLWSEHKVNSGFGAGQLPRYRSVIGDDSLMAITSSALTAVELREAQEAGATLMTWRDVLEATKGVAADGLDAHLLAEWVALCEHELKEIHVEALTPAGVEALRPAMSATEAVAHLIQVGFERACAEVGAGTPVVKEWWEAPPPAGGWLAENECLLYADDLLDDAAYAGEGEPAILIGAYGPWRDPGELRANIPAKQAFENAGFVYDDFGETRYPQVEIARTVPLRELTSATLLTDQEDLVTARLRAILEDLLAVTVP